MTPPRSPLTFAEAERVADALASRWEVLTGEAKPPAVEQLADMVQFVLRRASEIERDRRDVE